MPIEITMPRLSDTMESGTVLKWNVAVGDEVSSGDVVADIETDKATMELTVFDDGTISQLLVGEGETVDVGTAIATMAEDGEAVEAAPAAASAAAPASGAASASASASGSEPATATAVVEAPPPAAPTEGRRRISPVARHLADEHGLDLDQLTGSGPGGRIIKRDVLKAVETGQEMAAAVPPSAAPPAEAPSPPTQRAPVTNVPVVAAPIDAGGSGALAAGRVPLSNMRQTIAKRLVESASSIPHYQVSMTFDMDAIMDLRAKLNEQLVPTGVKLSVNDFLVRACALAMYQHQDFNASWDGDGIVIHGQVNIGIAIAVGPERGGGLVVGVIRDADRKSLRAISMESKALATKARERGLTVEEMSGATFTISNLGMFGVDHFTAIINPPNSAILAVGAAIQKPVVRDGELTVGHEMSATLSNDHRVIDGAMAAQYLNTVKAMMENPATVLV
ncbi:MAG: dihydrolipoamide acetyltransferase family protein [Planctomycetota bacterium]|jgi:pyruvate dehydrogenase E2 component (dihydrolipoamide acetyltransferase)